MVFLQCWRKHNNMSVRVRFVNVMYLTSGSGFYFQVYSPTAFDTYNTTYHVSETYRIQMSLWDTSGNVVITLVTLVTLGTVFLSIVTVISTCHCSDIEYSNCMQKGNQQFNLCMGLDSAIDQYTNILLYVLANLFFLYIKPKTKILTRFTL